VGLALVCVVLFGVDADVVETGVSLGPDLGVERWVQAAAWGPLVPAMETTNWVAGSRQAVTAGLLVALSLLVWRNLGLAIKMAVSLGLASGLGAILKPVLHRPRPSPSLVHVPEPAAGWSFPSGHAIFYGWMAAVLVLLVAPRVPPRYRPLIWAAAAVVAAVGCLGRVWAGVHWPTDVLGGLLVPFACVALAQRVGALLRRA
jgi:membrane-associated phospholipid phosphatase